MSKSPITALVAPALVMIALAGCGVRPHAPVPSGLTAEEALAVLRARQEQVHDFSARARATFTDNGRPQNVTLEIRYLAPGSCRVYVKAFAGIDMARLSVVGDSVTVYMPMENYYFSLAGANDYVFVPAPGVEIGFDLFERLFATTVPGPDEETGYRASLGNTADGDVVLTIVRGAATRRYVLTGPDLLVTAEEYAVDGVPVWQKTIGGYTTVDGIPFPSSVTVAAGEMSAALTFSDIELNLGFVGENLLFTIPPSAERYDSGLAY